MPGWEEVDVDVLDELLPLLVDPPLVVVLGVVVVVFGGVVVVFGGVVVVVGAGVDVVGVEEVGCVVCCVCEEGELLKLFLVDITLYTPASIIRSTIKNVTNLFIHIV